jgi:hypothetical protein
MDAYKRSHVSFTTQYEIKGRFPLMVDALNFDFQFFTTHVATGRPRSKAYFLTCTTKNVRENCHSGLGLTWYL